MTIIRAKDFLSKLRSDPEFEKRLQREYEKLTKEEREKRLKRHYKFLKDYIVQECKYYERAYSPDINYFPRRELLGYIDAYYDLGLINDDEEEKIVYIVEKLYQHYQNYVTLFLSNELLKECEVSAKKEESANAERVIISESAINNTIRK